jgi:linoleoyl-CoA desaturase
MKIVKFANSEPKDFSKTIHKRVNAYFKNQGISKAGNLHMYVKTTVMLSLYFVPYILNMLSILPVWGMMIMYLIMGVGLSGIGLCVMHDANHEAFSEKKWVNKLFSYSMNVVGFSSYNWKMQHNILHHTFTNIYGLDEDIHDKPFIRLSPHGKIKNHHRFQHIYAPLLYCFATISWFFIKDIKQLKVYKNNKITSKDKRASILNIPVTIITKIVYLFYVLALPMILGMAPWVVLVGFVIMHMVAGLVITTIFQLAHVVEGPEHHDVNERDMIESSRAVHQLKTTANFAMKNKLVTWFAGGLNFQVEHHLFPTICHVHYTKISKIVKETAKEFGLPYHHQPKMWKAVVSHLKVLKQFGNAQVV